MEDYPSGSHLVMKANVQGEVLYFVGYKYNIRKVLCFVCSENAGSFDKGDPYIARFPDKNGNVNKREVPRPAVISDYFKVSNKVDIHNQLRQFCLQLEKCWVTHWYVKLNLCFLIYYFFMLTFFFLKSLVSYYNNSHWFYCHGCISHCNVSVHHSRYQKYEYV